MVNFRTMVAMASIAALGAFGTVGCNGGGGGGGGGGTTTTLGGDGTTTTLGGGATTTILAGSTTTTLSGVTTTTLGGPGGPDHTCAVTVGVTSTETMGTLLFEVDYSSAGAQPGGFEGAADAVTCTPAPAIAGAITTFNDDEPTLTLRTAIISVGGFTGPTEVQTCTYTKDSGTEPVASDFTVTLLDSVGPDFAVLAPTLAVTLNCDPVGNVTTTTTTTTTTNTTNTTLPPPPAGSSFDITMRVDDALNYGALQWDVGYAGAPGGFAGTGETVSCTASTTLGAAIATFNDDEVASRLRAGIISLGGFAGPVDLITCIFDSTGVAPVAGDFVITIVDASDANLVPIVPSPTIAISSIITRP